jgi:hypothetical protein
MVLLRAKYGAVYKTTDMQDEKNDRDAAELC